MYVKRIILRGPLFLLHCELFKSKLTPPHIYMNIAYIILKITRKYMISRRGIEISSTLLSVKYARTKTRREHIHIFIERNSWSPASTADSMS